MKLRRDGESREDQMERGRNRGIRVELGRGQCGSRIELGRDNGSQNDWEEFG